MGFPNRGDADALMSSTEWDVAVRHDPSLPQTFEHLAGLATRLWPAEVSDAVRASAASWMDADSAFMHSPTVDMCGFQQGLRNPRLSDRERALLAPVPPTFQHHKQTSFGLFDLYWNSTKQPSVPESVVDAIGAQFEFAHNTYMNDFVNIGYPFPVQFGAGVAPSTDGSGMIQMPAAFAKTYAKNSLALKAAAYHECFHLVQRAMGWSFNMFTKWFLEGTTSWAEMKYTHTLTSGIKLSGYFQRTLAGTPLTMLSYQSLPFWLFLDVIVSDGIKKFMHFANGDTGRAPIDPLERYCRSELGRSLEQLLVEFGLAAVQGCYYREGAKRGGKNHFGEIKDCSESDHKPIPWPKNPCTETFDLSPTKEPKWVRGGTTNPMALRYMQAHAQGLQLGAEVSTSGMNAFAGFSVLGTGKSGGIDGTLVEGFGPKGAGHGYKPGDAFGLTTVVAGGVLSPSSFDLIVNVEDKKVGS